MNKILLSTLQSAIIYHRKKLYNFLKNLKQKKLRDEALAKSPISRRSNMKVQSPNNFTEAIGTMKYTENSIKRIRQCE